VVNPGNTSINIKQGEYYIDPHYLVKESTRAQMMMMKMMKMMMMIIMMMKMISSTNLSLPHSPTSSVTCKSTRSMYFSMISDALFLLFNIIHLRKLHEKNIILHSTCSIPYHSTRRSIFMCTGK
jgi:hypothetical protein